MAAIVVWAAGCGGVRYGHDVRVMTLLCYFYYTFSGAIETAAVM